MYQNSKMVYMIYIETFLFDLDILKQFELKLISQVQNKCLRQKKLIHVVRTDPCIQTCVQRLTQTLLYTSIEIKENGMRLKPELDKKMQIILTEFVRDAIEMAHICGFVAYYVKQHKEMPIFRCVPLGTFSWYSELNHHKESSDVVSYRVEFSGGNISSKDIHVVNFLSPVINAFNLSSSPMDSILDNWEAKNVQLKTVMQSEKWNTFKHVAVTEKIDLKDPTTSGLALLDDLRRYNLTGKHAGMNSGSLLKLKSQSNQNIDSATEGTFHWVNRVFEDENGEKAAQVHVMPPNTELHELSNVEYSTLHEYLNNEFQNSVYLFFDLTPPQNNSSNASSTSTQDGIMTRQQYAKIETMSRFCERLIIQAYTTAFAIPDTKSVECKINPSPRLQLTSIDQIKTLTEAGVMNPQDRMRVRGMFMER